MQQTVSRPTYDVRLLKGYYMLSERAGKKHTSFIGFNGTRHLCVEFIAWHGDN